MTIDNQFIPVFLYGLYLTENKAESSINESKIQYYLFLTYSGKLVFLKQESI